MASVTQDEAAITREQLRTFHIAGRGLEQAMGDGSLRPAALEHAGELPPFSASDLLSLYATSLEASREAPRAEFSAELKRSIAGLRELLDIDERRRPVGSSTETVSAALGSGGAFFDAGALAAALRAPSGGFQPMEAERRARIERTAATLAQALETTVKQPLYVLFEGASSFQNALEFCDHELEQFGTILRALRLARLEIQSAYEPAVHDEALSRFDWQTAEAEELLALPTVLVMETAERLAQASLTDFGRVLRSGMPVQILVTCSGIYADALSGFVPDFGYLAIAHREAFVLESSLGRPDHLASGFAEMTAVLRPAVAIVSVPASADRDDRAATVLAWMSRAFPLYRYDPDCGETWGQRFSLLAEDDSPASVADCAALIPAFRSHFRVIPAAAWDGEQLEIGEYLKQFADKPPRAIPYIWVTDDSGIRQRAVITREMVNLCRDRARAWRIFEELAGIRNSYVEAAVTRVRDEVHAQDSDIAQHARLDGANAAIQRVVAMLLQPGSTPVSSPSAAPATPPSTAAVPSAAVSLKTERAAEDAATDEPYVDSFLCTSCNDCFKINPRVFNYDGNKQAYIADARAGTFAELVKAAEGCPAKCIHPGTPRPGDTSVTPQLLAKAAKLR